MAKKYSHDELIERMKSPGWALGSVKEDRQVRGSLEDVLKFAHDRRNKGEALGLIEQIETAIELDMLQIEQLWRYMGLPV